MIARTLLRAAFPLLLLLVAAASCSRDPEKAKKAYVDRGNDYFKKGKYKEASIMYRSALKKDLRYGEAYYRLGLTDLRMGRPVDAMRNLRRAYELQPDNLDAASNLADLYLAIYLSDARRFKEYLKELEQLGGPILKKDPKSFLGLRVKGHVALANGNNEEALAAFQAANQIKPLSREIVIPLIQALSINKRFEEAEQIAFQVIEKDKTYAAIYDWLYFQYLAQKRIGDAEKAYVRKVENNPQQAFFILQLAGHYFLLRRPHEMEQVLQKITSNTKDFPLGYVQVGDFYYRIRDIENAVKHYETGLRLEPNKEQKPLYQKRLVETLVARGRKQEALDLASQILKANPKDYEAIAMRASLWLLEGSREKVQTAIGELNSVLIRNPENFVLRYNLGRAYVAKGDIEQARTQFQEAVKYRPDYTPARIAIAQLHLAKNEFTKAMQAAEEVLNYDTNNLTARMIRTSCRMGLGDLHTARNELNIVLIASPNHPDALFQMGILNYREKKYKEAEENFVYLQKVAPNDPRGLVGRVETLSGTKRFDEAIKLLQDDLKQNPDRSFYRLALANTAARAERFSLAVTEYRKLLEKNPRNFDVQIRLAEAVRRQGDPRAALSEFQKAKDLNPNDPVAYVRIALLYEEAGKRMDAKPLYEQILKLEPDNAIALNNLAYIIADTGGDLDQALTLAQRAKAKFPDQPNISDTLGWIYTKKNLTEPAIKIYRELFAKHENNSEFRQFLALARYHLAVALYQKGDKPSAKRELEIALKHKPSPEDEARIRELMARN
ncbi:MAG: tetratricopeptide repeat protein [Acidobacteria bacterium]|nr:tetratricopeptide repeat protein [Acidobacteriota bacterium]